MKKLCQSIPELAQKRYPQQVHRAQFVCQVFTKVFTLFGTCHQVYDSGSQLSVNCFGRTLFIHTEADIDRFMAFYRDSFPRATITPKLHMLEDHVVPFLSEWGVGLGFLGEHGAESIHARFNALRRNFVKIPNPTKRLHAIMHEHLLQVCPNNLDLMPEKAKRVFKNPRNKD